MFIFLELEQVHRIHQRALERHGGAAGLRDSGLVESAIASAANTFFYGNGDVWDVAAAYAFHLAEAQAFLDGNKRVGLAAAITFLDMNFPMPPASFESEMQCCDAMIAIARHEMTKADLAALFRRLFGGRNNGE
ncbi:MAG: type II toxin-antitoxin system death-on-curing family toxin [Verrucomicrobiota bacterium]